MDKFTKPQTYYDGTARERELCRNWQPDDLNGEYNGPYIERDRVPLPSCFRRWQRAREAAQTARRQRDFVRLCAAVPLVALADADDLARLSLGAANWN
jgi:hypothetical protein